MRRFLFVVMACCLTLYLGAASAMAMMPPAVADAQTFVEAYLKTLTEALPDEAVVELQDDQAILVALPEEEEPYTLNPLNAYAEYAANGGDMQGYIDHYVSTTVSILLQEDAGVLTRDNLMAVMKPQDYLDYLLENGVNPVYDPFLEGLVTLYVMDTPQAVRPIQQDELEEAGISREEVGALATQNLRRTLSQPQLFVQDGITVVYTDGMYEASLLLLAPEEVGAFEIEGDLIIAVPARDAFFVTGSEQAEQVSILRGFAPQVFSESGYPVTGALLRWNGEAYEWYE